MHADLTGVHVEISMSTSLSVTDKDRYITVTQANQEHQNASIINKHLM
jgi:hypothetical protein